MSRLPSQCPTCQEALGVTRLSCDGCGTLVEGKFELPALLRLTPDDLRFVEAFVRASGSLKEMARIEDQSYPTIRNRLDAIIAELEGRGQTREKERLRILDGIAKGKVS
ncbi:MAG TPA: DUF2089 family protein, partial [Polyangiaceae bacterium]|nr:DUF2089 family protein [Polyangiaceae bacterium]